MVNKTDKTVVKGGLLNGYQSGNQFDLCPQRLLGVDDTCMNMSISLLEAVSSESVSEGEGFIKCNCSGTKCNSFDCCNKYTSHRKVIIEV